VASLPGAEGSCFQILQARWRQSLCLSKAYRLTYRSYRQSPYDRAISQAFKFRQRLGVDEDIERPKHIRWNTFDWNMKQVETAEGRSATLTLFGGSCTSPGVESVRKDEQCQT
jgi:hypothetical protein